MINERVSTVALDEWDVSIVMAMTVAGEVRRRKFEMRIPCASADHAEEAAHDLGLAINAGSSHLWKLTGEIEVALADRSGEA